MPHKVEPKVSAKPKDATKNHLIETGIDLMLEKGFNATGLSDVLNACQVPKGSFYYYFKSKEEFGLQIINTFDEKYVEQLDALLCDRSLSPLDRMKKYIDGAIEGAEQRKCSRGCLIANLSQEMADQNELFRNRLNEIICRRRDTFARVLQEAKDAGELKSDINALDAAEFFLCGFEGAIMRSKVRKDTEPLRVFKRLYFERVLVG